MTLANFTSKILTSVLLGAILVTNILPSFQDKARAEGAILYFSPESGSFGLGKTFTVRVLLNSGGGVGVNAADGTVAFDPSYLAVQNVNKDNSVFSLWTSEPIFSNSKGTVGFSGGSPAAYTKEGGTVVSIVFRALKAGSTNLSITGASALAADGKGTNIISSTGKSTLTLGGASEPEPTPVAEPEPKPVATTNAPAGGISLSVDITSPTHPDQEKWYANKNPEFKWKIPPDVDAVSAILNSISNSNAPANSEGLIDSKKFEDIGDGVKYFHIRFRSPGGWSQTIHRRVLIDTNQPNSFEMELKPGAENTAPKIWLRATDETSGIDRYEVKVDDREAVSISPEQLTDYLYNLPPILPGIHQVIAKAIDKAGNNKELAKSFELQGRATVDITGSPGFIEEKEALIVSGIADAGARVILKLENEGKTIFEESVRADEEGSWTIISQKRLRQGEYEISARMITRLGAESPSSAKIALAVIGAPFVEKYGWILVMLLFFIICGLAFVIVNQRREFLRRTESAHRRTIEMKQKSEAIFAALDEEVEEKLQLMDEEIANKLGTKKLSANEVLDRFRDALQISEDTIRSDIEDITRTLE